MIANMSMNSYDQRLTNSKQTQNPFIYWNFSKSKIMKNLARTLSLFLIFPENYYKSKTRICVTELCYNRWFTTLKKWQSINRTNQESKYSRFMQVRNWLCCFSIHFLLNLSCYPFLLYKTPSGYCTSFAGQVRVTNEWKCRNARYLCENS